MSEEEIKRVLLNEVKTLAAVSRSKKVTVEIHDFPGRPFEVVTRPGGDVADWGIGGVGFVPPQEKVARPARLLKGAMRTR